MKFFNDNQSAIWLIDNPKFHKTTKHIDIQYHLIKERYRALANIDVLHISIIHQVVDMLIKTLLGDHLAKLCCLLGIIALLEDLPTYVTKINVNPHVVKSFDLFHGWECCN
jgi:hypothetical protein